MPDFTETQGGGAIAQILAASLNDTAEGTNIRSFKIGMQDTLGNLVGSTITATITWSKSGTEPGTLNASVSASAFTGNASYTNNINAIRLYYSTGAAPTTYTDWLEISLSSSYAMNNSGYTLDLTAFAFSINNL